MFQVIVNKQGQFFAGVDEHGLLEWGLVKDAVTFSSDSKYSWGKQYPGLDSLLTVGDAVAVPHPHYQFAGVHPHGYEVWEYAGERLIGALLFPDMVPEPDAAEEIYELTL